MAAVTSRLALASVLICAACSSSSPAPAAPSPTPTPTPTPTPPAVIQVESCPTTIAPTFGVDVAFYREMGCNAFDGPMQSVRRWTRAPQLYVRTVDDAGNMIDPVTLDTVMASMINTAAALTGGKFGLAGVTTGTDTRENVSGWITVRWFSAADTKCAASDIARDGGTMDFYPATPGCSCNGSRIRPRTGRHELGHALGYWHTDDAHDLMSIVAAQSSGIPCDQTLSAREQSAIAYHYR